MSKRFPNLKIKEKKALNYEDVKDKPTVLLALTSITKTEFENLLPFFEEGYNEYIQKHFIDEKLRSRSFGGGNKPVLAYTSDKLLFILYYMKCYPLQEEIGYLFGISQGQACQWIHRLTEVLKIACRLGGFLPERDPQKVEAALENSSTQEFVIDGTERPIPRLKAYKKQKNHYSGKKKRHTCKNNIIVDAQTRKIDYLSATSEGKKNDKQIASEDNCSFPPNSTLGKDKGFQGYEPKGVISLQPKKKPKGKKWEAHDRFLNSVISSFRIVVEHVISGIKRCHIVKDVFRNTKDSYDDLVMEVACGLHNFRTEHRKPTENALVFT